MSTGDRIEGVDDFVQDLCITEDALLRARRIDMRIYRRLVELNNMVRGRTFNLDSKYDLEYVEPIIREMDYYLSIIDSYGNRFSSKLTRHIKIEL